MISDNPGELVIVPKMLREWIRGWSCILKFQLTFTFIVLWHASELTQSSASPVWSSMKNNGKRTQSEMLKFAAQ